MFGKMYTRESSQFGTTLGITKGLRILSIVRKLHITRFDGLCYNVKLHLQLLVAYVTSKGGATTKIDLGMRHNRRKVVWE